MAKSERQLVINKAYNLLQAFDYEDISKMDIVPLESGHNHQGAFDYILVTTNNSTVEYQFRYDANNKTWTLQTLNEEIA